MTGIGNGNFFRGAMRVVIIIHMRVHGSVVIMSLQPAEKTVSFAHILLDITKEEEMKKHTPVTEAVTEWTQINSYSGRYLYS